MRANLSGMSVEGDDAKSPTNGIAERNLNFKTSIWELGLLGEYDLLTPRFNDIVPYVFAGVGVYHFNPKPLKPIDGKDVNLHDIGTEGQNFASGKYADRKYNLTQLNLQFGGGVKFIMSETFSICVEANYRRLFTDYLDDVSAPKYIPYSEWQAEIARNPGAAVAYSYSIGNTPDPNKGVSPNYKRGNSSANDTYYTFQVRLNFLLEDAFLGPDIFSPLNPRGRGQLRCSRNVF